ncbi:hypothetical protein PHET_08651 [Paragonimus heterotremus]|uniref:Cap-specific mRNA (nucleoside-2'-O-)-methyltransferase 1 n=1 Tax=Paragonimus heterotremus TaxID=100268 RepID=A0A8J4WUT2_9TREM|nr:hypothetical protein PHET_08651 [Paragonimus heterotremus]
MSGELPNTDGTKRKMGDSLGERAWKMMRSMGYEPGQGLGANAQGVVEPVAVSKQKGRHGLGLAQKSDTGSAATGAVLVQSSDPNLVWTEGTNRETADSDRVWQWRRYEACDSFGDPPDVPDSLSSVILAPDDPQALGLPVREIQKETQFCSAHLLNELIKYKNQLDNMSKSVVSESHERSNPFEHIKKGIFMNRAAMKLANMDAILNGLFTDVVPKSVSVFLHHFRVMLPELD